MVKAKVEKFTVEEQEAEYWGTHSPLDEQSEPVAEKLIVRYPKDKVITIRLDSRSYKKLIALASQLGVGHSTLVRLFIVACLKKGLP